MSDVKIEDGYLFLKLKSSQTVRLKNCHMAMRLRMQQCQCYVLIIPTNLFLH
jgi:hypothetical protein